MYKLPRSTKYADLGEATYGRKGRLAVQWSIGLGLLSVGIAGTLNQCVHALRWALVVALPAGVAAAGDGDVVEVVKVVFPALFWSYAYVSPLAGCALFLWQQTTFLLHQRGVLSWHLS